MRWSEAVTLEFVKIYLKHECLWNPAHPSYTMRQERDMAYSRISSEFKTATTKNLSVTEVKVKIKNLRTTYAQQLHKILQRSSPDSIYEPSLVWFQEMDRCLKNISSVRSSSNASHQAPEVDSSCQIWVDQEDQDNTEEQNPDPLISQTDEEENDLEQSQDSGIKREHQSPKPYKKIKKKKYKHRQSSLPDSNTDSVAREDEFDIYGKFIASQLRQMDLQKALRLQLEIQSLVSEARISDLS